MIFLKFSKYQNMTNMACARLCVAPTALHILPKGLQQSKQDVEVFKQPSKIPLKPLTEVFILATH